MHFLTRMYSCDLTLVHLRCALLTFEFPLGISETFLSSMLAHPSKTVPSPGVLLQQIITLIQTLYYNYFDPSNAELNPICHLLALLRAHHILYVSRIRVNILKCPQVLRIRLFCLCLFHVCPVYCSLLAYLCLSCRLSYGAPGSLVSKL